MADLTPERLQELRRIAEAATPGTYEWRIIETALALLDRIEALEQERDAARAEAERWRKKYEALRAEVESVAQELRKLAFSCAQDRWETGHPYHDGASDAYYEAGLMVRRVLGEAGGGR